MNRVGVLVSGLSFSATHLLIEALGIIGLVGARRFVCRVAWRVFPKRRAAILDAMGALWENARNPREARNAYEAAIKLEPDDGLHYLLLASLLEKQGDLAGAIHYYNAGLQHGSEFAADFVAAMRRRINGLENRLSPT